MNSQMINIPIEVYLIIHYIHLATDIANPQTFIDD